MTKAESPTSFPETRWSVILDARAKGDELKARRAMGEVCSSYWKPIYAYARTLGNSPADAEDLTQSFFERLLETDLLASASSERGRMRSFLLSCFGNHIHNVHRVKTAQKRGGSAQPIPMTGVEEVEREIQEVAARSLTPDQVYDRQCALSLVAEVLKMIEDEQVNAGRGEIYAALRPLLDPNAKQTTASQEEIALELGVSHSAIRGSLMRLRQRFREVTRSLISQTLRSPSEQEIDEELMLLRQSLL
ncbi:MAG: sigma-70 family RNA polymerase sigma factor [Verrucomicrobiaceae bacterium]|nr:sigma-70 family RNA polymerase sigma factor [Verrucomicrobiaceae bacterium]